MKIGLNIFWQHYKWLDNKELFSKTLKNWLLGILYRYIHCLYRYKWGLSETEQLLCIEACLHVSIHICLFSKSRKLNMIRSMLACLDTYQSRFQDSDICIDTHPCLYRYKSQFFYFFNVGQSICIDTNDHLYRYMYEKLCLNLLILFSL